jgi:hypothetical protein
MADFEAGFIALWLGFTLVFMVETFLRAATERPFHFS